MQKKKYEERRALEGRGRHGNSDRSKIRELGGGIDEVGNILRKNANKMKPV